LDFLPLGHNIWVWRLRSILNIDIFPDSRPDNFVQQLVAQISDIALILVLPLLPGCFHPNETRFYERISETLGKGGAHLIVLTNAHLVK
jgi:hypothetical protein